MCAGANQTVVISFTSFAYEHSSSGGARFLQIGAEHPAGSIISLHCQDPRAAATCPFFVKVVFASRAGTTELSRYLHHRLLAPGTILDVWVEHQNNIGKVLRFAVRRHVVVDKLCLPQTALTPEPCHR